jgi:hypothetical protein
MKTYSVLKYILILFLFAGTSCEDKVIDQGFTPGREYSLEINKLYTSADSQYSIIINEVSDSRCPESVTCIWSGEVSIKGDLTINDSKLPFEIHSVISQSNKQPDGYTIQIVDAKPYPKNENTQKPEDLIITLLVKMN